MRFCVASILIMILAGVAGAREANLDVNTPAIRSLKESMAARVASINKLKDAGQVGEGRDGLLAIRTMEGLGLGDKKAVEDLVKAENNDRRALYKEIISANGLGEDDAGRVMTQAGQARRTSAAPEHYVQDPETGGWVQRKNIK